MTSVFIQMAPWKKKTQRNPTGSSLSYEINVSNQGVMAGEELRIQLMDKK